MAEQSHIRSFTDLVAWQTARQFAVQIYKLTEDFPGSEKFGLSSQLQRAAVSIPANIAEGFSRKSRLEKVQFYSVALGSLTETESHLYIACDLDYINEKQLSEGLLRVEEIKRLLGGLYKTASSR